MKSWLNDILQWTWNGQWVGGRNSHGALPSRDRLPGLYLSGYVMHNPRIVWTVVVRNTLNNLCNDVCCETEIEYTMKLTNPSVCNELPFTLLEPNGLRQHPDYLPQQQSAFGTRCKKAVPQEGNYELYGIIKSYGSVLTCGHF